MAPYRVISQIGSGGFGKVLRAIREADGKSFALKRLDSSEQEVIERFQREVRILSSLDHPNIIKVLHKELSNDPYYYVMPLYKGSLVDEFPDIVGKEERIRDIYSAILDAVEYAHKQGVIHRDLKPENVLLNSDAEVVISDFGLGRVLDSDSTRNTLTGSGMGTPIYMAPEQYDDAKNADPRSDVYALGVILLELFQGRQRSGSFDLSGVPPRIEVIVRRCIHKNPDRRFPSVSELKTAWNSLYENLAAADHLRKAEAAIARLAAREAPSEADAQILLESLFTYRNDSDFVQKAVMTVNPAVFAIIQSMDLDGLRSAINGFTTLMTSQNWPFNFTDEIGVTCRKIFNFVEDFEVRADLIFCAAEVGISHNRWSVMQTAADLIAKDKQPGEAIPIKEKLEGLRRLDELKGYLNTSRLERSLRSLFEKKDAPLDGS